MVGKRIVSILVACGLLACALPAGAVIYSPTQAELLGVEFADFVDNANPDFAALNSKTASGSDAAIFNFTTDFDVNDNLWRMAMENSSIELDLSSYDAFNITFSNPVPPDPGLNVTAQIFVRSASDAVFVGSTAAQLNSATPVTLSISIQRIIDFGGDPTQISSFGIEFFGGDEFLGSTFSATASTSPQPPTLVDHTIYSWETPDNPATASVDERLEGWSTLQGPYVNGAVPHPDHTHAISTSGATDGTHALQLNRLVTGQGLPDSPATTTFRWGSRKVLDANAGAAQPQGDYNADGTVNAADYTRWRDALGTTTQLPNDPSPGTNNQDDYNRWKTNFGQAGGGPNQAVLAEIAEIVELVNDPDAYSVSFDIRFEDQFPDSNPGWANFFMSIQATDGNPSDGNDAWWQGAQVDLDLSPLGNGQPVVATLDFPLAQFDDQGENGVQSLKASGLDPATQYLIFNLASNVPSDQTGVTYEFLIDNFRIRHIAPGGAGAIAAAAPEPSTAILILVALAGCGGSIRRR